MALPVLLILGAAAAAYLAHTLLALQRNVRACRASGIPYVVLPFQPHTVPAQILDPLWRAVLFRLPGFLRGHWLEFMYQDIHWTRLYAPFRALAADSVLTCSAGAVVLHTADAGVIAQVAERRADFPKPTWIYDIVDIYGKSSISVEGALWRRHRKITSVPFTEKNNHLVWTESVFQTQQMLRHTVDAEAGSSATVDDVEHLTSRIALAIISKAGYGIRMRWPGSADTGDEPSDVAGLDAAWVEGHTGGHTMSYSDAIFTVTRHILWLMLVPQWLLALLPLASPRAALAGYRNWGQYMREMVDAKRAALDAAGDDGSGDAARPRGTDLLAALVRAARADTDSKAGAAAFTDDELLGNAFLLIVAGHETTAGVLCVGLQLLAMHPASQRALQADVAAVVGDAPPADWAYDRCFTRLLGGTTGAVLAEVLRWMPPVPSIPKWAADDHPVDLGGGRAATVPRGTLIALNVAAAHRNPHQWPHGQPQGPEDLELRESNPDDDLGAFKPARWLRSLADADAGPDCVAPFMAMDRSAADQGEDEKTTLLKPRRGAFIPFSEGSRACLGRRFGQVEVVAMLATIFQSYSVELAVDEWATDDQVRSMTADERAEVWRKARDAAQWKFRHCMQSLMTNRMTKGHIPLRLVKKGEERFM